MDEILLGDANLDGIVPSMLATNSIRVISKSGQQAMLSDLFVGTFDRPAPILIGLFQKTMLSLVYAVNHNYNKKFDTINYLGI